MGAKSAIEWTEATWNPIRGCSRVSEGCRNCYAERDAIRHVFMPTRPLGGVKKGTEPGPYHGLVKSTPAGPRWTGEVRFVEEALNLPLRWRSPRRIFVNSMSDLFHEKVADEWIDRIFSVMAQTERHTYQVLTKRPDRMHVYGATMMSLPPTERSKRVVRSMYRGHPFEGHVTASFADAEIGDFPWPLRNVWLGVSVENQATVDERIPLLLQTPAAVRFLSVEPLLSEVDLSKWLAGGLLHWVIVGGESGPSARVCHLESIAWVVDQCRAAGVPCFVKQIGSLSANGGVRYWHPKDRKGGDPAEWPENLRVREYPR